MTKSEGVQFALASPTRNSGGLVSPSSTPMVTAYANVSAEQRYKTAVDRSSDLYFGVRA